MKRLWLALALAPSLLSQPSVPRAWDDRDIAGYRLPLAGLGRPPALLTEREYYALPEVNLKTYPVYTPDKEPAGYLDWLKQQEPQPLIDVASLKSEVDWIAAGREIFYGRELPRFTGSVAMVRGVRAALKSRVDAAWVVASCVRAERSVAIRI